MCIREVLSQCSPLPSGPLSGRVPCAPQALSSILSIQKLPRQDTGSVTELYPTYFSSLRNHYFLLPGSLCLESHCFIYFVHSFADSDNRTYLIPVIPCWWPAEVSTQSYIIEFSIHLGSNMLVITGLFGFLNKCFMLSHSIYIPFALFNYLLLNELFFIIPCFTP